MNDRWRKKQGPKPLIAPNPAAASKDPYARWGVATHWRGFARASAWTETQDQSHDLVQIIACLNDGIDDLPADPQLFVSDAYRKNVPGTGKRAKHFTASVKAKDLDWLMKGPKTFKWELAVPLRDAERIARATAHGLYGQDRDSKSFVVGNVLAPHLPTLGKAAPPAPLGNCIAVIDFGCPFLNPRFANKKGARIGAIWDQGSQVRSFDVTNTDPKKARIALKAQSAWPWRQPAQFNYGRELPQAAIASMVAFTSKSPAAQNMEETAVYKGIDYLIAYDDPRRRVWLNTHGAHVLDMAGGTIDPLLPYGEEVTCDAAGSAPLVFVQLPTLTAADSAGGSLSAHVLDALRFVLDVATPAPSPKDAKAAGKSGPENPKIVVNLSYGTQAGPHDGSSLIESAMDELLRLRESNFAIVVAAGNSRQSSCHMRKEVLPGRSALMRLALVPGDTTDTFVEIWYAQEDPARPLQVRVRPPDHDWCEWIGTGEQIEREDPATSAVNVMLRVDERVPSSGNEPKGAKSLILLAMAPTAPPDDVPTPLASPGLWEIEVRMAPHVAGATPDGNGIVLDAWIERDDPGDQGGEQTHWLGLSGDDNKNTLNSLATGKYVITAGGFRLSDASPADYSSTSWEAGAGFTAPMVMGACEEDSVQRGIRASAVRTHDSFRMNGSSVGAPVVARRVFNWMARTDASSVRYDQWPKALVQIVAHDNEVDNLGNLVRAGAVKKLAD